MEEIVNGDESGSGGGFVKFYGLYWRREFVYRDCQPKIMPGIPAGWIGRGRRSKDHDSGKIWMNFWDQRGVYVLYDRELSPVYAGQAGLLREAKSSRQTSNDGRSLGDRINDHTNGKYRNAWIYFSWFGFLQPDKEKSLKGKLKNASQEDRINPEWKFRPQASSGDVELNLLLDSFEAVLIEAFTPRFNARGGNLKEAIYVDQLEELPAFLRDSGIS